MDIEYITKELNKKFAAPLKEYYPRRVVFWYDPDKEFAEDVQELVLDNAKVFALTGSNSFEAKMTLQAIICFIVRWHIKILRITGCLM